MSAHRDLKLSVDTTLIRDHGSHQQMSTMLA